MQVLIRKINRKFDAKETTNRIRSFDKKATSRTNSLNQEKNNTRIVVAKQA